MRHVPSSLMNTYVLCCVTPNASQSVPASSSTWGKPSASCRFRKRWLSSDNASPGTPTKRTWSPNSCCTSTTVGASRFQNGHHGAQNQSTTSSPCSDERSMDVSSKVANSPVSSSFAVGCAAGSASAAAAVSVAAGTLLPHALTSNPTTTMINAEERPIRPDPVDLWEERMY